MIAKDRALGLALREEAGKKNVVNPTTLIEDPGRLKALADTHLLDSAPEEEFDQITSLACRLLRAPIALVSLVTDQRQFFKSSAGLPLALAGQRGTPLSHSLCQYVVETAEAFVVTDSWADERIRESPAVWDLGVRAYAGVPLATANGHVLGSFCVIDDQPRQWTPEDLQTLHTLGGAVRAQIELRLVAKDAQEQAQSAERAARENAALLESTAEGIYGIDENGNCTFVNSAAARMLGYPAEALLGENMHLRIHHTHRDGSRYSEVECPIYETMITGRSRRVEDDVFWRADGVTFPVDYCSSPLIEDGVTRGAVVAFADISARKEAEALILMSWDHDRRVAEALQRAIVREVAEDAFPGLSIASRYLPAWQEARIGGDFFDAFALDDGQVAFVVGDASGKGLSAAVRTAEAKFALRAFLREGASPGEALARLNNLLCAGQRLERRDDSAFIVLSLAVLECAGGQAVFATAGAEPPLLLRATGEVEPIPCQGFPLGFLQDQQYDQRQIRLGAGDTLLMATDGITEARSGSDFLGYDGMTEIARLAAPMTSALQDVAQALLNGALDFAGGSLHDDACLLLVRRE